MRRDQSRAWLPIAAWLCVGSVLALCQYVAPRIGAAPGDVQQVFAGWNRYDGPAYLHIATEGYAYPPGTLPFVAWFPAYPLAIRLVAWLTGGDPLLSAVAVSAAAGLTATVLFWRWLAGSDPQRPGLVTSARPWALALAVLYPYGWFLFGVPYSDSLFLACAIGAFLLLEAGRPGWAGALAAVATATRVNGVALAVGLLVLALERDGVLSVRARAGREWARRFAVPTELSPGRVRPRSAAVLLSLAGLVGYMLFLWKDFGDPLLFYRAQSFWNHGPGRGWESLVKLDWLGGLWKWTNPHITATSTAQALLTGGALVATPFVGRRFGWGYASFVAVTVAMIIVSSADFLGAGRYLMSLFPLAALAGEWISGRRAVRAIVVGASALALLGLNFAWSRNVYLT
jgi:hypothetical protein